MSLRYSHPPEGGSDGTLLEDHLEGVATRARYVVPETATTPSGMPLRGVVETLAYLHDFGKATTYFQQHLDAPGTSGSPPTAMHRHHAPLGALAAYYALDARGFDTETCVAGFVAVGKHHGTLPHVAAYVHRRTYYRDGVDESQQNDAERRQVVLKKQAADINDNVPELASDLFERATDGSGSWDEFCARFDGLLDELAAAVEAPDNESTFGRRTLSTSCYALVQECWGALVFADKTDAAGSSVDPSLSGYDPVRPSLDVLDSYIDDLEASVAADPNGSREERLNQLRSRAREDVVDNAAAFADDGGGVATITLPTGLGKTLSGLSAALTVRDRLGADRVVYALPFTSVIDQVVEEIRDVYDVDATGGVLTAHHHLSETTIEPDGNDADAADRNDDVAGMLAEGWRAGLTVTTFVQLFESLAGPSNAQSMKIPALRNSVIVLDEPQSLPLDWWKLVPRLARMLIDRYDATVIAMTATQPRLFADSDRIDSEPTELVEDPDAYFGTAERTDRVERVVYELDGSVERYLDDRTNPRPYAGAADRLADRLDAGESVLAVCNTIDSARELHDAAIERMGSHCSVGRMYERALDDTGDPEAVDPERLAERIRERADGSVLHLSTRLRPIDRLTLIETAKQLTETDHALLTVSTQLVEAGVDISFDRVYRDLAPIDSIVQAAGRCNRSFERDRGTVTVWWLDAPDDKEKTPAEAVYNRGVKLLPVTANTLDAVRGDSDRLDEATVARQAVERYYATLNADKNVGKEKYAKLVDEARGDELSRLSLIDERRAVDVVVCRTETELETVREANDAVGSGDFETASDRMDDLRTVQISIPVYRPGSKEEQALASLPRVHQRTDVRYVDSSQREFEKFFDPVTGFVVPDSTAERRIL